ncbi:hypothetical protein EI94DRAFT_1784648 [Lactarius quietus]|nr:hypothetical protein EI94DRAFT_1784648 [Lactarius quietus]
MSWSDLSITEWCCLAWPVGHGGADGWLRGRRDRCRAANGVALLGRGGLHACERGKGGNVVTTIILLWIEMSRGSKKAPIIIGLRHGPGCTKSGSSTGPISGSWSRDQGYFPHLEKKRWEVSDGRKRGWSDQIEGEVDWFVNCSYGGRVPMTFYDVPVAMTEAVVSLSPVVDEAAWMLEGQFSSFDK